MSKIEIISQGSAKDYEEVARVFFESSSVKTFASQEDKDKFQYKYLDYYRVNHPEYFFFYKENEVFGYICGAASYDQECLELHSYLAEFRAGTENFPAHLHINLTESSRGNGIGSKLVAAFEARLKEDGITGCHLITTPDARNVSFYERNGYQERVVRKINDIDLLLLGKRFTNS